MRTLFASLLIAATYNACVAGSRDGTTQLTDGTSNFPGGERAEPAQFARDGRNMGADDALLPKTTARKPTEGLPAPGLDAQSARGKTSSPRDSSVFRLSSADRRILHELTAAANPSADYIFTDDPGAVLGHGMSSIVYRVCERGGAGRTFAAKHIIFGGEEVRPANIIKEIEVFNATKKLGSCVHLHKAYLVLDVPDKSDSVYLIMDYIDGGSLDKLMGTFCGSGERYLRDILEGTLSFLSGLHDLNIIHRDMKPSNILRGGDMVPYVADFGLAHTVSSRDGRDMQLMGADSVVGTGVYVAPEALLSGRYYTEKIDIWALGITAFVLARNATPYDAWPELLEFAGGNSGPFFKRLRGLIEPPLNSGNTTGLSPGLVRFLRLCLEPDPERRPSARDLLKHSFITGLDSSDGDANSTATQPYWPCACVWSWCRPPQSASAKKS